MSLAIWFIIGCLCAWNWRNRRQPCWTKAGAISKGGSPPGNHRPDRATLRVTTRPVFARSVSSRRQCPTIGPQQPRVELYERGFQRAVDAIGHKARALAGLHRQIDRHILRPDLARPFAHRGGALGEIRE